MLVTCWYSRFADRVVAGNNGQWLSELECVFAALNTVYRCGLGALGMQGYRGYILAS